MSATQIPEYNLWLSPELESSLGSEAGDALVAKAKQYLVACFLKFGLVPSEGDSIQMDGEIMLYVCSRDFYEKGGAIEMQVILRAEPMLTDNDSGL